MKIEAFLTALALTYGQLEDTKQLSVDTVVATIFAEARGEGYRGMRFVLGVIHHRCKVLGLPPDSVVTQPKQFAVPNSIEEMLRQMSQEDVDLWRRAVIAVFLHTDPTWLEGDENRPNHYLRRMTSKFIEALDLMNDDATHFCRVGQAPESWKNSEKMTLVFQINNHAFWKEEGYGGK